MSRSGKLPIPLPKGVEVKVAEGKVQVKGPKGQLEADLIQGTKVAVEDEHVVVTAEQDHRRQHGLCRALVSNMVVGTSTGFEKKLELIGVGFRAAVNGQSLELSLGFSHPTAVEIPTGITIQVEKNTLVTVQGIDRQLVGQVASDIRALRPPEPYKGKGVRYVDEYVRKKAGKSAK